MPVVEAVAVQVVVAVMAAAQVVAVTVAAQVVVMEGPPAVVMEGPQAVVMEGPPAVVTVAVMAVLQVVVIMEALPTSETVVLEPQIREQVVPELEILEPAVLIRQVQGFSQNSCQRGPTRDGWAYSLPMQIEDSAVSSTPSLFQINDLPGTISIRGGHKQLLPVMEKLLRNWHIDPTLSTIDKAPLISLEESSKGFIRRSNWLSGEKIYKHPVNAVCDFIVDLIHAYLSDKPDLLCLHCAGVEFAGGLVLFPNTYQAGKSTLVVKLAALGLRLFSDDVIPYSISKREGMALSIPPRLRIPLPNIEDNDMSNYIGTHKGPKSDRFLYCDIEEEMLAPLGEFAPIAGITILERSDEQAPRIQEADKGEVLRNVILRNFSRRSPALNILDTLFDLVERTPCYTLTYSTPDQAAELLITKFGTKMDQATAREARGKS
ncbi:MAG: hypothetical protein RPU52_11035 [Candidatus Sedimenticola sp. (ex Thyasira tokunagai)]